ncbi:MAG TPA: response regulator [Segetibacter sp.]
MFKVNIHIAEDDRDDFLLLNESIEAVLPKFNISHSRNGQEFLEKIYEEAPPDLIFLDLNMPKKNGIDCLIEFKKKKKFKSTPVIIYSTSANWEDIDACYRNGCTLYMVKPTSYNDLLNQVRKIFFRLGLPKKDLLDREMFVVKKHEETD